MSVSEGFSRYTDDRDPSVQEMIRDTDSESKKRWHKVRRIDANGVEKDYLLEDANYKAFAKIASRHDAEFNAWMNGGE